jgi:hypothetical protein
VRMTFEENSQNNDNENIFCEFLSVYICASLHISLSLTLCVAIVFYAGFYSFIIIIIIIINNSTTVPVL